MALDEVFVTIDGVRKYLWRAVDQYGNVLDILIQSTRDGRAATRFFRKILKQHGRRPRVLVTGKLRSYQVAHRQTMSADNGASAQQVSEQSVRELASTDPAT